MGHATYLNYLFKKFGLVPMLAFLNGYLIQIHFQVNFHNLYFPRQFPSSGLPRWC